MNDVVVNCASYTPSRELLDRYCTLFEAVYGSSEALSRRVEWEFLRYPSRMPIKFYCAEAGGKIVAVTVRIPLEILCQGRVITAYFATNSMVHPEYRGKGLAKALYKMAADTGGLQLSKGTADGMYKILKKIGYQDIVPNTYQVCIISPIKWLLWRVGFKSLPIKSSGLNSFQVAGYAELHDISGDLQCFLERSHRDGIIKDCQYLSWRYLDIPHRSYRLFLRKSDDLPISLVVTRIAGNTMYLVDLIWDTKVQDEPEASLAFTKKFARHAGVSKLIAWATLQTLRNALSANNFYDRGESPNFSCYSAQMDKEIEWSSLHIVHGDGDIEYL